MIIFAAYRNWAIKACLNFNERPLIAITRSELETLVEEYKENIKAIIFVGWSEIIPKNFILQYLCLCYHPSDLPKYRGGSPLQHQIIDGVLSTKGTLFKMDCGIDTGPIFAKENLSLSGDMEQIFAELESNAFLLIQKFLQAIECDSKIEFFNQDESAATFYKRRNPEMSEITLEELLQKDGEYLYNKIRSLGDPYPNTFIKTVDGKRLLIKKVELI